MKFAWLGIVLALAVGCSAPDHKNKLVGTWQNIAEKTDTPITYNADGTYVQTLSLPNMPNATVIIKGTYKLEGNVISTTSNGVQVYGLMPQQAAQEEAKFKSVMGKEFKTNFTFVNDNEIKAEAGKQEVTFRRVGPG